MSNSHEKRNFSNIHGCLLHMCAIKVIGAKNFFQFITLLNATKGGLTYGILGNIAAIQGHEVREFYFNFRNLIPGIYILVSGEYKARMIKE